MPSSAPPRLRALEHQVADVEEVQPREVGRRRLRGEARRVGELAVDAEELAVLREAVAQRRREQRGEGRLAEHGGERRRARARHQGLEGEGVGERSVAHLDQHPPIVAAGEVRERAAVARGVLGANVSDRLAHRLDVAEEEGHHCQAGGERRVPPARHFPDRGHHGAHEKGAQELEADQKAGRLQREVGGGAVGGEGAGGEQQHEAGGEAQGGVVALGAGDDHRQHHVQRQPQEGERHQGDRRRLEGHSGDVVQPRQHGQHPHRRHQDAAGAHHDVAGQALPALAPARCRGEARRGEAHEEEDGVPQHVDVGERREAQAEGGERRLAPAALRAEEEVVEAEHQGEAQRLAREAHAEGGGKRDAEARERVGVDEEGHGERARHPACYPVAGQPAGAGVGEERQRGREQGLEAQEGGLRLHPQPDQGRHQPVEERRIEVREGHAREVLGHPAADRGEDAVGIDLGHGEMRDTVPAARYKGVVNAHQVAAARHGEESQETRQRGQVGEPGTAGEEP